MASTVSIVHDRVIFLDYDGVLNSYETQPPSEKGGLFTLHKPLVERLDILCKRTHAAVVVSSTWRHGPRWEEQLREAGFTGEVLGRTGSHKSRFRGEEVDEWMRDNGKDVRQYAILDDDHDFYPWQPTFHPSLFTGGLTWEIVNRVADHFDI